MKKSLKDDPKYKKQFDEFNKLYLQLKKRRKIKVPPEPTGNKKKDLFHHFSHYINIIHIKLVHQLQLLLIGIKAENPEMIAVTRSIIETIGALAYITQKLSDNKTNSDFIWNELYIATMGQNTKTLSKKTTFSKAPQIFHSNDYIREANKVLNEVLDSIGSKNKDYILETYDFISEFTHPNYLALQAYWQVDSGILKYNKNIACLRGEELEEVLVTIIPLILAYELVLRRAEKLEKIFKDY